MNIILPWPNGNLSQNSRAHWRNRAESTRLARRAGFGLALEVMRGVKPTHSPTLKFTYFPPDKRRRDAQNMPAMLKPYIDGIADAFCMDDHGFRCVFPSRFSDVHKGGKILVEISK